MRVCVLGGDGYLGWLASLYFSRRGHKVLTIDNFAKRRWEAQCGVRPLQPIPPVSARIDRWRTVARRKTTGPISFQHCDLSEDYELLAGMLRRFRPDPLAHFAEQPSAPFSMASRENAIETQRNKTALLNQLVAVLKAQDELVKKQNVAVLIWEKAKADVARADVEAHAAEFVYEPKRADQKKAELAAEVLQQRIDDFTSSPELTRDFYLTAPKDGVVTECSARPGEVIAVKTPIFQIFNPDGSYAVVFFDPADIDRLVPGQPFTVKVGGIGEPVTACIAGFYPELPALPNSLTRYFWQQEKWSQYAPVRLDFDHLSLANKSRLLAWAQLSASRWEGRDLAGLSLWQWVARQFDGVRHFATAVTEQKAFD
jgi:hypothetical protein